MLRAAELNDIYIPSLCSHKDLLPFGGCRLCMVEIAGMRGYPLACSTTVQEGMQVLTDTVTLREMRQEILQLILSEHPSSCLCAASAKGARRTSPPCGSPGSAPAAATAPTISSASSRAWRSGSG